MTDRAKSGRASTTAPRSRECGVDVHASLETVVYRLTIQSDNLRPCRKRAPFSAELQPAIAQSGRMRQRDLHGNASVESAINGVVVQADGVAPIHDHLRLTAKCHGSSPARVPGLLVASCPAYISRRIPFVVIYALDGVFRGWPRPNIGHEGREGSAPLFAHLNPAPSVVSEPIVVWVVTATLYMHPDAVFGRVRCAVSLWVTFFGQAAAGLNTLAAE